jgi:prophage regulatory protein
MSKKQRRILRLAEVKQRTGRPTSSIYDLISKNRFPRPVPLGPKAVGWVEDEIDLYIEQCIAELTTAPHVRSMPLAGSKRRKMEASPKGTTLDNGTRVSSYEQSVTGKSKSTNFQDLSDTSDPPEGASFSSWRSTRNTRARCVTHLRGRTFLALFNNSK